MLREALQRRKEEARELLRLKKYAQARAIYEEVLAVVDQEGGEEKTCSREERGVLWLNIGICHQQQDCLNNALQAYQQCLQLHGRYSKVYYRLAQTYIQLEKYEEAQTHLNTLKKLEHNAQVTALQEHLRMSWVATNMRRFLDSVSTHSPNQTQDFVSFFEAIHIFPDSQKHSFVNQVMQGLRGLVATHTLQVVLAVKQVVCQNQTTLNFNKLDLKTVLTLCCEVLDKRGKGVEEELKHLLFIQQKVFEPVLFYAQIELVMGCAPNSLTLKVVNSLLLSHPNLSSSVLPLLYRHNLGVLSGHDFDQHLFYNIILLQNTLQRHVPDTTSDSDFHKALSVLYLLRQNHPDHEQINRVAQSVRSFHQNSSAFQLIVLMISEYLILQRNNQHLQQLRDSLVQVYEQFLTQNQKSSVFHKVDQLIIYNHLQEDKQKLGPFMNVVQMQSLLSQPIDYKTIQVVYIYCIYEEYKFILLGHQAQIVGHLNTVLSRPKGDLVYQGQMVNTQLRCLFCTLVNLMQDSNEQHKRYMVDHYEMNDHQFKEFQKLQAQLIQAQKQKNGRRYDKTMIQDKKVVHQLCSQIDQLQVINVLQNYQHNLDKNLVLIYLHFCLLVVSEKSLANQFIQRPIIQFFLVNLKESTAECQRQGQRTGSSILELQELSSRLLVKVFANSNVSLFRFEDLTEYVSVYHKNVGFLSGRDEIEIFEFQLSMVNILGHHPSLSQRVSSPDLLQFLFNNMCNDNRFLQTSSIELLNNLLIDNEALCQEFSKGGVLYKHLVEHLCFFYGYALEHLPSDQDPNPYTRRTRQLTILTYILAQIQEAPLLRQHNPFANIPTQTLHHHLNPECLDYALGLKQYLQ